MAKNGGHSWKDRHLSASCRQVFDHFCRFLSAFRFESIPNYTSPPLVRTSTRGGTRTSPCNNSDLTPPHSLFAQLLCSYRIDNYLHALFSQFQRLHHATFLEDRLPLLSVVGLYVTYGLSIRNNTLALVNRSAASFQLPGSNFALRRWFTGIGPIDNKFRVLLSFWLALSGDYPDASLRVLRFAG